MTDTDISFAAAEESEIQAIAPGQVMRQRAFGHTGFLIGAAIIVCLALIAIFAPLIAPHDPFAQSLSSRMLPPAWVEGGTADHLLGTDQNGRDYLSRLIFGARVSIAIGIGAASIGLVIGVTLGVIAGYFGGWVDHAVSFLLTAQLALPGLLLAMALVFIIGPSIWVVIGIVGVLHWTYYLVVTRAATQRIRSLDFVAAAQAAGASPLQIIWHEILPNLTAQIIVIFTFELGHRDPRGGIAVLPRRRHPAADPVLGPDDRRGQAGDVLSPLARRPARHLPVHPGDRRQPPRRRPARHHLAGGPELMAPLLDIRGLSVTLPLPQGELQAVRDVTLTLERGEALGLVGESGSGKSMTALALMRLLPRGARTEAEAIRFDGAELRDVSESRFAADITGRRIGMIFQEPMTSLNPVYSIGRQLTEAAVMRGAMGRSEARDRAMRLLDRVGIADPEGRMSQYPHQLSGGQRQRVMIAMALMLEPELLDRRRAHDRARRHRAGADPRPARRPAARDGDGSDPDLARPRRGGGAHRQGGRALRRRAGGAGAGRRCARAPGASLYPGAAPGDPAA